MKEGIQVPWHSLPLFSVVNYSLLFFLVLLLPSSGFPLPPSSFFLFSTHFSLTHKCAEFTLKYLGTREAEESGDSLLLGMTERLYYNVLVPQGREASAIQQFS